MTIINILLLEDTDSEINNFNRAKEKLESECSDYEFKFDIYKKIDNKIYLNLLKNNYDFAIIDLKLGGDNWEGSKEFDGNKFIEHIYEKLNIPIIINTGNVNNLDKKFQFIEDSNNPLFFLADHDEIESKLEDGETHHLYILKYILNLYKTGITKVIGKHGKVNEILNKLIWNGGLDNIREWERFNNLEKAEKSLGRYILSHIHHELSGDYEDFHPEEIYLKLMKDESEINKNDYITGTILEKEGKYYIILTPACDIAQNKNKFYKLYKINSYPNSNSQKKKCSKLSKFILEKSKIFINGGCIDFEDSISVKIDDIENYNIICYLSPFFLKDLVFQLGNYYSRQGSPDLNNDVLLNSNQVD